MKRLLTIVGLCSSFILKAQTTEEWFQQQKTQKKYLLKQIAALHEYVGYVQKGFAIAEKGLTTISSIKHGDFTIHNAFFSALKQINPAIAKYSKTAEIVSLQYQILADCKKSRQLAAKTSQFERGELIYINSVCDHMLSLCSDNVDELTLVIAENVSEMKDDERIKRIDKLYADMVDKALFLGCFLNQVKTIAANRTHERNDVSTSRSLYGVKNN